MITEDHVLALMATTFLTSPSREEKSPQWAVTQAREVLAEVRRTARPTDGLD